MEINTGKIKLVRFVTRRDVFSYAYAIASEPIEAVVSFKYLGIHLTVHLS